MAEKPQQDDRPQTDAAAAAGGISEAISRAAGAIGRGAAQMGQETGQRTMQAGTHAVRRTGEVGGKLLRHTAATGAETVQNLGDAAGEAVQRGTYAAAGGQRALAQTAAEQVDEATRHMVSAMQETSRDLTTLFGLPAFSAGSVQDLRAGSRWAKATGWSAW
jgi:hypothetical protein